MYMAIYNKYDGEITYIPIGINECNELLDKYVSKRGLKYLITHDKNLTSANFELLYGKKIFEPIVDAYIPVNTTRKSDNEINRLVDFFSFIHALVYRRHKGLYNRDIGAIGEIERYIEKHFGITP